MEPGYEALMVQAQCDIEADSVRHGSKERPEIMVRGARVYHLAFSRDCVHGGKVQMPRHFLVYRRRDDE